MGENKAPREGKSENENECKTDPNIFPTVRVDLKSSRSE